MKRDKALEEAAAKILRGEQALNETSSLWNRQQSGWHEGTVEWIKTGRNPGLYIKFKEFSGNFQIGRSSITDFRKKFGSDWEYSIIGTQIRVNVKFADQKSPTTAYVSLKA